MAAESIIRGDGSRFDRSLGSYVVPELQNDSRPLFSLDVALGFWPENEEDRTRQIDQIRRSAGASPTEAADGSYRYLHPDGNRACDSRRRGEKEQIGL